MEKMLINYSVKGESFTCEGLESSHFLLKKRKMDAGQLCILMQKSR